MGLYDKYARLAGERLQFSDNGLTPFGTCIDEVYSATEGRIGNKKVILAGTNNYLGLT
ncbi:TPA: 8-amino-7-oxononanoate synthase, partial [Escherichia coli]|nr:8-amino-7-oxononanoate synthase [Escherichia coli]EHS3367652.1 8-amino-7-oxononanoate synthase [Escherichia coli]EIS9546445.1 8-amino-7-oxononanoate synthase [Escherichia coli]EJC6351337.1 8-amino-7-oxononanoate synthase [Escherichia coli]EJD4114539.1 8-amino-7-oxononanoate synthase [Escherichia coli]